MHKYTQMDAIHSSCACCGRATTSRCARCKGAFYCSRVCQIQDRDFHEPVCAPGFWPWKATCLCGVNLQSLGRQPRHACHRCLFTAWCDGDCENKHPCDECGCEVSPRFKKSESMWSKLSLTAGRAPWWTHDQVVIQDQYGMFLPYWRSKEMLQELKKSSTTEPADCFAFTCVALFGDEQFLAFGDNRPVVSRVFNEGAVYFHPDAKIKAYIDRLPIDDKGLWAAKDAARPGTCLIQTAEGPRQLSISVCREIARDRLIAWACGQERRVQDGGRAGLVAAAGLITCMTKTPEYLDAQGMLRFHVAKSFGELEAVCKEAILELNTKID